MMIRTFCAGLCTLITAFSASAALTWTPPESVPKPIAALVGGDTRLLFRPRYTSINETNLKDANATTLLSRVSYTTQSYMGFIASLELDHVSTLFDDDYNDSVNDKTDFATEPDMSYTDLNQAWIAYQYLRNGTTTRLRYGNQRIAFHNHRFIGNVGWRQNEQTYSSITLFDDALLPNTSLFAGYIYNVKSNFNPHGGDDNRDANSFYSVVDNKSLEHTTLSSYLYWFDLEDELELASNATFGIRAKSQIPYKGVNLLFTGEVAYQEAIEDAKDVDDYHDWYWKVITGLEVPYNEIRIRLSLGWETLQGQFFTPLATLHAMNGWADRFIDGTGDLGLMDASATLHVTIPIEHYWLYEIQLFVRGHHFEAESDSLHFGDEIDLEATLVFTDTLRLAFKHASYDAASDSGIIMADSNVHKTWVYAVLEF